MLISTNSPGQDNLTNEKTSIELFVKEIEPSTELLKWFGHDPAKWKDFKKKFLLELKQKKQGTCLPFERKDKAEDV